MTERDKVYMRKVDELIKNSKRKLLSTLVFHRNMWVALLMFLILEGLCKIYSLHADGREGNFKSWTLVVVTLWERKWGISPQHWAADDTLAHHYDPERKYRSIEYHPQNFACLPICLFQNPVFDKKIHSYNFSERQMMLQTWISLDLVPLSTQSNIVLINSSTFFFIWNLLIVLRGHHWLYRSELWPCIARFKLLKWQLCRVWKHKKERWSLCGEVNIRYTRANFKDYFCPSFKPT